MNLSELEDLVVNEIMNNNRFVKKIIMRKDVYEDFNKSLKPITRTISQEDLNKMEIVSEYETTTTYNPLESNDLGNIVKAYLTKTDVDIESSDSLTEEYELVF